MAGRETKLLMKAYMQSKKPVGFFQSLFKNVRTFNQENVDIDIVTKSRRMADFNVRGAEAKLVSRPGFKTYTYKPPILNEKHVISYAQCNTSIPGEDIYSPMSAQDRAAYHRLQAAMDFEEAFIRREEYMAKQAFFDRKIDIANGETISFPGSNDLLDISPTADWDAGSGVNIIKDVHDACEAVLKESGELPNMMVLGSEALAEFNSNSDIQTLLDTRYRFGNVMETKMQMPGLTFLGRLDFNGYVLDVYTYVDWYDVSGTDTALMPSKKALLLNENSRRDRLYGAIEANGVQNAIARYVDTWEQKDPDGWIVRMQSAPLLVPSALNTWATIEALS